MGGLAAARVLADHFDRVTVLDRDELPAGAVPAEGRCRRAGTRTPCSPAAPTPSPSCSPASSRSSTARGAAIARLQRRPLVPGRRTTGRRQPRSSASSSARAGRSSRRNLRRRVAALPNVTIESRRHGRRARVRRRTGSAASAITTDGIARTLRADLVVDCSGRGSRGAALARGDRLPAPRRRRGAVRRALRDDRRCAAPAGRHRRHVRGRRSSRRRTASGPGSCSRSRATAGSSRSRRASAPTRADRRDELPRHRRDAAGAADRTTSSTRRRTARSGGHAPACRRAGGGGSRSSHAVPAGFVALGDAICSFNPIYGQGMSSAVLQAVRARRRASTRTTTTTGSPRAFYKRAAKVIDNPWKIAVGADFAYPGVHRSEAARHRPRQPLLAARAARGAGVARGQHDLDPRAEPARPTDRVDAARADAYGAACCARGRTAQPHAPKLHDEVQNPGGGAGADAKLRHDRSARKRFVSTR